jgi:hypothetical protein
MLRFILTVIFTILTASISYASDRGVAKVQSEPHESARPFWTEQSSFTIGDALYAIGVATNAASVEEGRQAAFANGLGEIRNYYGPVSNLDGVVIETEMTYQEEQQNGRVSVWRLLQVSLDSLRMVKATKTQALPSHVRTTHEAPRVDAQAELLNSTDAPRTAAVNPSPVRSHTTAVITRQPVTTQEVNLPSIPLRYPQIITGWTQDTHGRIGVASEDRQEWYVPVLKASDLTYARSLLNPR